MEKTNPGASYSLTAIYLFNSHSPVMHCRSVALR